MNWAPDPYLLGIYLIPFDRFFASGMAVSARYHRSSVTALGFLTMPYLSVAAARSVPAAPADEIP
jgi:hypothetical protein